MSHDLWSPPMFCKLKGAEQVVLIASMLTFTLQLVEGSQSAAEWSIGVKGHLENVIFKLFSLFQFLNAPRTARKMKAVWAPTPPLPVGLGRGSWEHV